MTEKEQTDHFADDVDRLVDRYRSEYEMTYASVIGVLQMKIWGMCAEANDREDEA